MQHQGRSQIKSRAAEQFAEDIGLLAGSRPDLQNVTTQINKTRIRFDLMNNAVKTKTMVIETVKETPI